MPSPFPPGSYPYQVDDESGPILPPWYVRGWTAQNALTANIPAPQNPFTPVGFPADQVFVTVVHHYFDMDSNPVGGYLTFWPSSSATITETDSNDVTQSWTMPQRLAGTLTMPFFDAGISPTAFSAEGSGKIFVYLGMLVVKLLAWDTPNLVTANGAPLTYHVVEHMEGGTEFDIQIPASALSATEPPDLYGFMVPGTQRTCNFDPLFPLGNVTGELFTVPEPAVLGSMTVSHLSTDYVFVDVTAAAFTGGAPFNPTGDDVFLAFTAPGTDPVNSDWVTADWMTGGPPFVCRVLVGPSNGGLALAKGKYDIWVKIVDDPEVPVIPVGTLKVT